MCDLYFMSFPYQNIFSVTLFSFNSMSKKSIKFFGKDFWKTVRVCVCACACVCVICKRSRSLVLKSTVQEGRHQASEVLHRYVDILSNMCAHITQLCCEASAQTPKQLKFPLTSLLC